MKVLVTPHYEEVRRYAIKHKMQFIDFVHISGAYSFHKIRGLELKESDLILLHNWETIKDINKFMHLFKRQIRK